MRVLPVAGALRHCWRSITANRDVAIRMSWPWMVVIMAINAIGDAFVVSTSPSAAAMDPAGYPVLLATLLGVSSLSVNWHRYIFLDEAPAGFMERLRLDRVVWRYFGNMLIIIATLVLAATIALIAVAMVAPSPGDVANPPASVYAITALLIFAAAIFFYRLAIKLPAIAIGRTDYGFRNALADTRGNVAALAGFILLQGLAFVAVIATLVIAGEIARPLSAGARYVLLTPLIVAINWLGILWNVTVLTSLYGFFAEGRKF
jgi:hypothetical protein